MSSYTLNIQFDPAGLNAIRLSQQKVTLVKATMPSSAPVAWVTFVPQLNNTITWSEEYAVYASTTEIESGATIHTSSAMVAAGGNINQFETGYFPKSTAGLPQNKYGIHNNDPDPQFAAITAGLAQAVSGSVKVPFSPLNATNVLYNNTGVYTPVEKVKVFAEAHVNNALVLSDITSPTLEVDLTQTTTQTIHYDSVNHMFAKGPLPTNK